MAVAGAKQITYRFHLARGIEEISLSFDADTFRLLDDATGPLTEWAKLEFHQCPHCPLQPEQSPYCPFARALSRFVHRFDELYSYETAVTEVVSDVRTVVASKPLQQGMASLIGLIGATSGCPHLDAFRPMARFHLPFARDDETLYRVFSMYLLQHYLEGGAATRESDVLEGLRGISSAAAMVNRTMAERVRAAFQKDVLVNAIIILDSFAQAVPIVIEERLEDHSARIGHARASSRRQ